MTDPTTLFQKPSKPVHIKLGIYGNTGSGKTFTAGLFAIGMAKELASKKPVAIFDTETGSDYLAPMFDKAGVKYVVVKSRSFAKLLEATKEAEKMASVLLVDSISHVWEELIEAYKQKKGRRYIQINEWGEIKAYWNQFTKLYLNSKLDIIMCGRAQDITDDYTDDSGQRSFEKVGERMKGEKYMGYEPSILIRMEMQQDLRSDKVKHTAIIEKDRTDTMTGKIIDDPKFADIKPIWDYFDHDGDSVGVDDDDSTQHIADPDKSVSERVRRRKVACELIQNALVKHIPGQAAPDKKAKLEILQEVFGTTSWTQIEEDWQAVRLEDLEAGIEEVEAKAQAYANPPAQPAKAKAGKGKK